jgi:hypothetical protein
LRRIWGIGCKAQLRPIEMTMKSILFFVRMSRGIIVKFALSSILNWRIKEYFFLTHFFAVIPQLSLERTKQASFSKHSVPEERFEQYEIRVYDKAT